MIDLLFIMLYGHHFNPFILHLIYLFRTAPGRISSLGMLFISCHLRLGMHLPCLLYHRRRHCLSRNCWRLSRCPFLHGSQRCRILHSIGHISCLGILSCLLLSFSSKCSSCRLTLKPTVLPLSASLSHEELQGRNRLLLHRESWPPGKGSWCCRCRGGSWPCCEGHTCRGAKCAESCSWSISRYAWRVSLCCIMI